MSVPETTRPDPAPMLATAQRWAAEADLLTGPAREHALRQAATWRRAWRGALDTQPSETGRGNSARL